MSDDEQFYVVDEDRSAVVAGPFDDRDDAVTEAREGRPSFIVATGAVLEMMELTSDATIRWETDEVDVVTDGGQPVGSPASRLREATKQVGIVREERNLSPDTDESLEYAAALIETVADELEPSDGQTHA